MSANPWPVGVFDALLNNAACQGARTSERATESRPGTKTARLLELLADADSMTTFDLTIKSGLEVRAIWGLLKQPRAIGQVRFDAGRWSIERQFAGRDVERAVALLRDAGWRVQPPSTLRRT